MHSSGIASDLDVRRRLRVVLRSIPISPFIPANGWLGRSHRGMLNVSLLGFHFFFSFELPYLKASKKANLATDLNVTNQSEQNHLMSASSLCRMYFVGLK